MPDKMRSLDRPLYRSGGRPAGPLHLGATAHAGLWYDKFCHAWQAPQGQGWTQGAVDKLPWIKTVTQSGVGDRLLLAEYADRRSRMVTALGGTCLELITESRFVTGIGREHPVENGFAWHATLGTPYLPGSSVKGIVRAWARQADGDTANNWQLIMGQPEQTGRIIFLDALPLEPVRLEPDVMTPHYTDYYQSSNPDQHPPGDWLSPTPIPFLAVAPGGRFQFAVIPKTSNDKALISSVEAWLREALAWRGGGAKTAVGYGRFVPGSGSVAGDLTTGQAPKTFAGSPGPAKRPRYGAGERVRARRVQDPKGKNRLWFEADDGFGGTLVGVKPEDAPTIAMDHTVTLEIAAPMAEGYNFRLPRKENRQGASPKRRGKRE
jgi:CRISPR-associated protein Cmr6